MTARRHHFLPQCYLRGFSQARKRGKVHQVVVFDRDGRSFTANIANIAVERDFNRVEIEGHEPDALEKGLAEFESELGPALARIATAGNLSNLDDKALLLNFIGLVSVRNPQHRETWRDFNEQVMKRMLELSTATEERWSSLEKRARAQGDVKFGEVSYERMKAFARSDDYKIVLRNEAHISAEFTGFDAILPTLFKRKWHVLRAPRETAGFITCDNPSCLMFSKIEERGKFHGPGHGLTGTELIFPVSRRIAVVGAFELPADAARDLSEESVAGINGAFVAYADRQVYGHSPNAEYTMQYEQPPRRIAELPNDLTFVREKQGKRRN